MFIVHDMFLEGLSSEDGRSPVIGRMTIVNDSNAVGETFTRVEVVGTPTRVYPNRAQGIF